MNFESAYEKYINGTATEEESAFVREEIEKSKRLTAIIDRVDAEKPILTETKPEEVKRAQQKYAVKSAARTALICILVLLLAAIVTCSAIFGTAFAAAERDLKISTEEAKDIAIQFVADNYGEQGVIFTKECEREIDITAKLSHSVYYYHIEVQNGNSLEIELIVNAKTGLVTLEDVSTD